MSAARASNSSNRALPLGDSRFAHALPARPRDAGPGRSRLVVAQFLEHCPAARVDQGFDARINRGFNKTSLVTYWVDPEVHQIVKYTFDNPGLGFLRFRWLPRVEGLECGGGSPTPCRVGWAPSGAEGDDGRAGSGEEGRA